MARRFNVKNIVSYGVSTSEASKEQSAEIAAFITGLGLVPVIRPKVLKVAKNEQAK